MITSSGRRRLPSSWVNWAAELKERIANLCFLRNRLRARLDRLACTPAGQEIVNLQAELQIIETNLDDLRRARIEAAIAGMRRPA